MAGGHVTGATGSQLLDILWGTASLALAHWFAFRLPHPRFGRPGHEARHPHRAGAGCRRDVCRRAVECPGAVALPVLAQETTGYVPAVVIGVVGYLVRALREARPRSSTAYRLTLGVSSRSRESARRTLSPPVGQLRAIVANMSRSPYCDPQVATRGF